MEKGPAGSFPGFSRTVIILQRTDEGLVLLFRPADSPDS